MIAKIDRVLARPLHASAFMLCLFSAVVLSGTTLANSIPTSSAEEMSYDLRTALEAPLKAKRAELGKSKDSAGNTNKRSTYSRNFHKIDDSTYEATMHVDTAELSRQVTERLLITVKKEPGKDKWAIAEEKVVDTYVGLHRENGYNCYPFDSFSFDREGMKMSASGGGVCESYYDGDVFSFAVMSTDMAYDYSPPEHVNLTQTSHDAYALHKFLKEDHLKDLVFEPHVLLVQCDPESCEELLNESFTGLTRVDPSKRTPDAANVPAGLGQKVERWITKLNKQFDDDRKESPFGDFRRPYQTEHKYYAVAVLRDLNPRSIFGFELPGSGVALVYDNWEGWEVQFIAFPYSIDIDPEAPNGPIFGYYSEETLKNNNPYELERREDSQNRWYEVQSLKGTVEAGLDDPEMLSADIEFGIILKQELQELPFFIASIPERGAAGDDKPPVLFVNSIQHQGEELTWVKTGPVSGLVVLPEVMPAGTKLDLRMNFDTRAIIKRNHAFNAMSRFGWMPFVSFGDFIDEFELTIKTPAKYKTLGVGKKVGEERNGDVLTTHWKAENPVVFPTIIYGKYQTATPKFDATKKDGTVIPVEVHVDEVSMGQLAIDVVNPGSKAREFNEAISSGARGIRLSQLRPIAEQAANAINLFREISGLDYPYGELNLVNDPAIALYGQAPSSLIYLGSLVFRGEGSLAGGERGKNIFGGGGTRTAKFLKSVTAHEVGHQWWGSRVSNANQRNYWFVESLAEYFSAVFLEAVYGPKEYQEQLDEWRGNILNSRQKSSVQNASSLWSGEDGFGSYQAAVYSKGPYAFHMLRETFGDEKFFDFLKKFSMELAEKREIVSLDIQQAAEKALGGVDPDGNPYNVDLSWFFDQWIRGVGIPQYRFVYDVRQTEDGGYLVEGEIEQRVVVGSGRSHKVLEGKYYRGVVDITVQAKGEEYKRRVVVQDATTPFKLKVPKKPLEVALNKRGEILSHDVVVNKSW